MIAAVVLVLVVVAVVVPFMVQSKTDGAPMFLLWVFG
jgi:hypothetical protein